MTEKKIIKKIIKKESLNEIDIELKKAKSIKNKIDKPMSTVLDEKYSGIILTKNVQVPKKESLQFVPVHIHTDYSTKDSVMSIDEYVNRLKELNLPGGTITEHGNMSSALKFYKAMKKENLKPILGCEIYTDDNIDLKIEASLERGKNKKKSDGEEGIDSGYLEDDYGHIVLLAPNKESYHELLHTNAKGFRDGFYKRPRVTHEYILNTASKHQIATTACLASKFNYYIRCGEDNKAKKLLDDYKQAFGDRFYVELHFNELLIQKYCTEKLLSLAKELNIPWIIGLDSHYARKEDVKYHDYLKAIHYGGTVNEPSKFRYNTRELYIKDSNEILHSALKWGYDISSQDIISGLNRTMEIYDRTNFEMELGVLKFPKFSDNPNFDQNEELKKKCIKGFYRRKKQGLIPLEKEKIYKERFNKEFPVIVKKGFSDYFLVVSDLTDYCSETTLHRGPGRGSAAGSVISWFLGVTEIDPIKHELYFERFLNEERADPPDIDIDFDSERRHELEEKLLKKYGSERVAHVMSFGTFAGKGGIRDLSRVFEVPFSITDKICKLFLDDQSVQQNLDRIMGKTPIVKNEKEFYEQPPSDIKEFVEENEDFFEAVKFFEGKVRHYSLHAAGIVVTPTKMEDYIPINRVSGQISAGLQEGGDIREISDVGLLKIDALGLNNCSIVNKTLESIKKRFNKEIDIWSIDLEDDNLLERFRQGHTKGIFQFESNGITDFITELQPTRFEDLVIVNAAYRPGTLNAGGVDKIIANRHEEEIDYMHPLVEEVLGPTYNVLVYQEQQMALMNKVGGFSLIEADKSRKTIKLINKASTASPEQLEKFYKMIDQFKKGAHEKTGLSYEKLQEIVDSMAAAADYSFNKSHSCSYAVIAMQNMFLKHYYPADYAASFLSRTKNEEKKGKAGKKTGENKIEKYMKMATTEMNLKIDKPDISLSGKGWIVKDDETIIPSLDFIKGVGDSAVPEILKCQPFNSIEDFFNSDMNWRLVNKRVGEALIKTGTFENLYPYRKTLLEAYLKWNSKKTDFIIHLKNAEEKIGKEDYSFDEQLQIEKEIFGFYFSCSPLDKYRELIEEKDIKELRELIKGKKWKKGTTYGLLIKVYFHKISNGSMAFIDLQDSKDNVVSIVAWPEVVEKYKKILQVGNIVALKLKPAKDKNGDNCFHVDSDAEGKKVTLMEDLFKNYLN